jgi:hypothetical protein
MEIVPGLQSRWDRASPRQSSRSQPRPLPNLKAPRTLRARQPVATRSLTCVLQGRSGMRSPSRGRTRGESLSLVASALAPMGIPRPPRKLQVQRGRSAGETKGWVRPGAVAPTCDCYGCSPDDASCEVHLIESLRKRDHFGHGGTASSGAFRFSPSGNCVITTKVPTTGLACDLQWRHAGRRAGLGRPPNPPAP